MKTGILLVMLLLITSCDLTVAYRTGPDPYCREHPQRCKGAGNDMSIPDAYSVRTALKRVPTCVDTSNTLQTLKTHLNDVGYL